MGSSNTKARGATVRTAVPAKPSTPPLPPPEPSLSKSQKELLKFVNPTGLYKLTPWDRKLVKKQVLEKKLAPLYPGTADAGTPDAEECPICFLHYPVLNQSDCCRQRVCSECYLQVKPQPTLQVECPFCKCKPYSCTFKGPLTREQREKEQLEQRRVKQLEESMRADEARRDSERQLQKAAVQRAASAVSDRTTPQTPPPRSTPSAVRSNLEHAGTDSAQASSPSLSGLSNDPLQETETDTELASPLVGARTQSAPQHQQPKHTSLHHYHHHHHHQHAAAEHTPVSEAASPAAAAAAAAVAAQLNLPPSASASSSSRRSESVSTTDGSHDHEELAVQIRKSLSESLSTDQQRKTSPRAAPPPQ